MALERVWPKDVYVRQVSTLAGKLYTQVIKATGTRVSIHVAGTLPFDKDNNLVGEGSMRLQVRAVLDAIGKSLAAVVLSPPTWCAPKPTLRIWPPICAKDTRSISVSSATSCQCRLPWASRCWLIRDVS